MKTNNTTTFTKLIPLSLALLASLTGCPADGVGTGDEVGMSGATETGSSTSTDTTDSTDTSGIDTGSTDTGTDGTECNHLSWETTPCCHLDGHFLPEGQTCNFFAEEEHFCDPEGCGGILYWKTYSQTCTGSSASCDGELIQNNNIQLVAECNTTDLCSAEQGGCIFSSACLTGSK